MRTGNAKAKFIHEIWCGIKKDKKKNCTGQNPLGPKVSKYRGRDKCWGCPNATWVNTGKPYGPWKPKEGRQN